MTEAKRVIFLDRDGTLNKDEGYTYRLEDYELLPGVIEGLKKLQDAGYGFVILTSQSGIGRGMYSEETFWAFMKRMQEDFEAAGIRILGTYFCPHHPKEGIGEYKVDCDCRKPKPGLVLQAEKEHGPFDYARSWAVGDGARDIEMVKNANGDVRGVIFPKNFGTPSQKEVEPSEQAEHGAKDFADAVAYIVAHS